MIAILAKVATGIALVKAAKHLDRRDVSYTHLKGDRKAVVAWTSAVAGGALLGAAIGDTVVKIVGTFAEE